MVQTRVTCDVSSGGKVKSTGVTGMFRHWARDVEVREGMERSHSNQGIDPNRSLNNVTYFPTDGSRSEWERPASIEQIQDRLDARLATVTGRKRKDAVVMRGVVLGLSPEWVEEHTPNWRTDAADREKFMDALQPVVDCVIEKAGGAQNVILVTGHFDEVVPQIQMAVTPVTEDGRLRQNSFDLFKSPTSLRKLHEEIRKELKKAGLDVTMESSERSREHLSNLDYARKADKRRAEEMKKLDKERQEIAAERRQLDEEMAKLPEKRKQARKRGKEEGYREGREEAGALYEEVQRQQAEVEADRKKLDEEKARLPEMQRRARRKGHLEGQKEVRELLDDARQQRQKYEAMVEQASDMVAQARVTVEMLRRDREKLDKERQAVSDAITTGRAELQQVREELEAAKASREGMERMDSEFLDELLRRPEMQEEYDAFEKRHVERQKLGQRLKRMKQQNQQNQQQNEQGYTL